MPDRTFDVLIVGGGVIGSSVAYFLKALEGAPRARVGVIEPDPTYQNSSTALSVGGIRHQFSTSENILLSLFASEFFRSARETLAVEKDAPELGFAEKGYLFLATAAGAETLSSNVALQRSLGAEVALLPPEELASRFPWLNVSGLAAGGFGVRGEGWIDPYSLLQAFRKKAAFLGVEYLRDRVVGLDVAGGEVAAVRLESGATLAAGILVNAAGPRAAEVSRMAGIQDLPVRPRKRFVYRVHCPDDMSPVPLTIDPSGVYFRPEGPGFLCGVSPPTGEDPDTFDLTVEYDLFHKTVWPNLAHRVPAFQRLKLKASWAGLYAVNTADHNAILGPHPQLSNFLFANGFSGHGLQHAPGVGRGLAEWILHGEYRTIDLSVFGFSRFAGGELILERNVI